MSKVKLSVHGENVVILEYSSVKKYKRDIKYSNKMV